MFNPIFGTLNNQIELTLLARRRVEACRALSAEERTKLAKAEKAERKALSRHVQAVENHAQQWKPFVHVLPLEK